MQSLISPASEGDICLVLRDARGGIWIALLDIANLFHLGQKGQM